MKKLSPRHLVVAAALFGIAAESAWSEEAAPDAPAAPAAQAAAPEASVEPGYAPAPYPHAYEPAWQPPPRPEPPPGYYGGFRPYHPPYPPYWAAPAAPVENPLSAELKQAQEQLASKESALSTAGEQMATLKTEQQTTRKALQQAKQQLAVKTSELNSVREQLASVQAEQQAIREVMEQAQAETAKASEQLSVVVEEMDILYEVLSELKSRLDLQNISLQGAVEAGAEEDDQAGRAVKHDPRPAPSPAGKTPVQPAKTVSEPAPVSDEAPAKPESE